MGIRNDYDAGVVGWEKRTSGDYGDDPDGTRQVIEGEILRLDPDVSFGTEPVRHIGSGRDISDIAQVGGIKTTGILEYNLIDDNVTNSRIAEAVYGTINPSTGVVTLGNPPIDSVIEYIYGSLYRRFRGYVIDMYKMIIRSDNAVKCEENFHAIFDTNPTPQGTLPTDEPTGSLLQSSGNVEIILSDSTLNDWLVMEAILTIVNGAKPQLPVQNSRDPARITAHQREFTIELGFLQESNRVLSEYLETPANTLDAEIRIDPGDGRYVSVKGNDCKMNPGQYKPTVSNEAGEDYKSYVWTVTGDLDIDIKS